MIRQWKLPTVTGNSSATTPRPVCGLIQAVYIAYAVTPNGATDVTIATPNDPVKTVLTVTNNNTSGWYYPREVMQDPAGADVTFDGTNEIYGEIPVSDYLTVTVVQGDADQTVDVWVLVKE